MTTIEYVSEITGSGKTGAILDEISNSTERYIIALPNKSLCREVYTRLTNRDTYEGIKIINGDNHDNPSNVLAYNIKKPRNTRIIITTHMSFSLTIKENLLDDAGTWNLIVDEELAFYHGHEINVSELSKSIIMDTVDVEDYSTNFYKIKPKDLLLWYDIAIGKCEETFLNQKDYVEFVKYCTNTAYCTLIPKDIYNTFIEDTPKLEKKKFSKFYAISICDEKFFSAFNKVTILCSFFEKTISYKLMKWMGLNLNKRTIPNINKTHNNTHLINIHYYCKSNWSKLLKKKIVKDNNVTLEEYIKQQILERMKDNKFIYNTNVEFRKSINNPNGTLVTSTHGVNKYINYTNMMFMPSLNATAGLVNVLSFFDLKRIEIDFARNVLHAYQFLSRGAVRKLNNNEEINIYVMDERTVLFLKTVLPNARITYHDAETLIEKKHTKRIDKSNIPNNVASFMSRLRKRLERGEIVREKTLEKYKDYKKQYYK